MGALNDAALPRHATPRHHRRAPENGSLHSGGDANNDDPTTVKEVRQSLGDGTSERATRKFRSVGSELGFRTHSRPLGITNSIYCALHQASSLASVMAPDE